MSLYRPSQASEVITVLRTITTTTTISAFGSADGFVTPGTEFGDDEQVMVAGSVKSTNNANLTGVTMMIWLDGVQVGTALLYGYDGTQNFYQFNLGILAEGSHTVEARFPRTRK
jgi:hypothetical protein